jgi:uncharacterized damage-inducible protein DinB
MNLDGQQLSGPFRTVRANTIQIADEIPEDQYGFSAAPGTRTVGEMLAHVASLTLWPMEAHGTAGATHMTREMFMGYVAKADEAASALTSKAAIVAALRANGEAFASWLDSLDTAALAERVTFPPPMQPASKSRFEMLLGVKEHEMHHRAQLMLIERMLGIVPHLTRNRQAAAR